MARTDKFFQDWIRFWDKIIEWGRPLQIEGTVWVKTEKWEHVLKEKPVVLFEGIWRVSLSQDRSVNPLAHTEMGRNSSKQAPVCREVHTQGPSKLFFSLGATGGQRTTRALCFPQMLLLPWLCCSTSSGIYTILQSRKKWAGKILKWLKNPMAIGLLETDYILKNHILVLFLF